MTCECRHFASPTRDAREKGDEGVYAAMRAAALARALHGMTHSRLELLAQLGPDMAAAAAAATATATTSASDDGVGGSRVPQTTWSLSSQQQQQQLVLGLTPAAYMRESSVARVARVALRESLLRAACPRYLDDDNDHNAARNAKAAAAAATALSGYRAHVPVGLPDDAAQQSDDAHAHAQQQQQPLLLQTLLPHIRRLRPGKPLCYDDWLHLCALCGDARARVLTLDLGGAVACPTAHTTQPPCSTACMLAKLRELQQRYPLPAPHTNNDNDDNDAYKDDDDDDDAAMSTTRRHNAALQARCAQLRLPCDDYATALRTLALHEMGVYRALCSALAADIRNYTDSNNSNNKSSNNSNSNTPLQPDEVAAETMLQLRRVQVLRLDHNRLGEESATQPGHVDMSPLRALARALEANETLRVVDLAHNNLRASGVGIVAKALTRNIALRALDLSHNAIYTTATPLAEVESDDAAATASSRDDDDGHNADDEAVFGDVYSGCEALGELLTKNKFLRVLQLACNGLHAGEDTQAPPPPPASSADDDDDENDDDNDDNAAAASDTTAPAAWASVPLWQLLRPLQHYHRLEVLDLSGNALRSTGARMLAHALSHNRALRVLDVSDNAIGARGLCALARRVVASPTSRLHTLVLRRNQLAAARGAGTRRGKYGDSRDGGRRDDAAMRAMRAMARALRGNTMLRCLIVADNHLGPALSAALLSTLCDAHALEELDMDYNDACGTHPSDVDTTALHAIAAALYKRNDNNNDNDNNGDSNCNNTQSRLRCLRLCGNNIGAAGLAVLFPPHLSQQQQQQHTMPLCLTEVYLARNHLGNALLPLTHALQASPSSLHTLDLSYNHIANAQALLAGLRHTASLRVLDLSHNRLGYHDALACTTTTAMPSSSSSHATTTAGSTTTTTAATTLRDAVVRGHAPHSDTHTCDAFAQLLRSVAHAASPLECLDLSWNELQPAHMQALHAALTTAAAAADDDDSRYATATTLHQQQQQRGMLPAPRLRVLDVSHNPHVPWRLAEALVRDVASRAGLCVLRVGVPAAERAHATQPLLRAIHDAVVRNDALHDVCCTLAHASATTSVVVRDEAAQHAATDNNSNGDDDSNDATSTHALIDDIRRRFLLHALLAADDA